MDVNVDVDIRGEGADIIFRVIDVAKKDVESRTMCD